MTTHAPASNDTLIPHPPLQRPRTVERQVTGQATQDGAGVKLTRVLTHELQQRLDPFLMLDHFASDQPDDYIAGFPNHPHRGFETVTYMVAGRMRHRDSAGHEGLLDSGGVQWMTAGRGLIHSEFPEQSEGLMEGFQLWLNLPARDKLCPPWYRDIPTEAIPEILQPDGTLVRVISGQCQHTRGAVHRDAQDFPTDALYLDLQFASHGGAFSHPLPVHHHAFVYVYRGSVHIEGDTVPAQHMAILANNGDGLRLHSEGPAKALLIAGAPLNEPIAQYGPFVMNTRAELMQAVHDFQNGLMG
jgi:redox-sensitive bicupin YhaK (pirin superfamily)